MLISQLLRYSTPSSCTTHSPVLIFPPPSYSAYYSRTTTSPVLSFQLPSVQNRTLAYISRTRHARSPQRVARAAGKSHSRLHFTHSTRTISAEGCAGSRQIALSPAFRALDTHDLRRGLRGHPAHPTLTCISRTRHAGSPQRVARAAGKSHSRLHFAHSTRTISGEGCAHTRQIALSPAFRALDTHDLRRGLRALDKSHSRLHLAHSTRTISAKGCTFG